MGQHHGCSNDLKDEESTTKAIDKHLRCCNSVRDYAVGLARSFVLGTYGHQNERLILAVSRDFLKIASCIPRAVTKSTYE